MLHLRLDDVYRTYCECEQLSQNILLFQKIWFKFIRFDLNFYLQMYLSTN